MAILPPGVSAANFAKALKEFEAAVGKEWVITDPDEIHPYRDYFSILKDQDDELVPSAAVCPGAIRALTHIARAVRASRVARALTGRADVKQIPGA